MSSVARLMRTPPPECIITAYNLIAPLRYKLAIKITEFDVS